MSSKTTMVRREIFWVAGLLLALIDFPAFGRPLGRIADSLETIAGSRPGQRPAEKVGRHDQSAGCEPLELLLCSLFPDDLYRRYGRSYLQ